MVSNNSNVTRKQMSVQVQQMLKQAGIDAEIKYYPADVLFAPAGMGGILQLGKFDLSVAGWYAGIDPDDSSQSLVRRLPAGRLQLLALLQQGHGSAQNAALTTTTARRDRRRTTSIQDLLARDNPFVFMWWIRQLEPI